MDRWCRGQSLVLGSIHFSGADQWRSLVPGPINAGPINGAEVNQWCWGQSMVPRPINGAGADQQCQHQSMGLSNGTGNRLSCPSHSMAWGAINAGPWCQGQAMVPARCGGQSIVREPIDGAKAF